VATGFPPQN